MTTLKLTQIGNSLAVILPQEILPRLKLEKGDTVFVTDTPGRLTLTPFAPTMDEQVALGLNSMREYGDTFRRLAK